ncbi:MAG: prephenate dehydrogenase/arogenate dehydrogenase family protein [Desulfobulbaceae bacterium]|nr:MAG: prephenate dehydrogenase/arogenate dehydrogenase family protein [Desulfobulbaceae bacterium]
MKTIATLGPIGSDSCLAVREFEPDAEIQVHNQLQDVFTSLSKANCDLALIPVYNTREGEVKEYFRLMEGLEDTYWIDNIVLPIHLSLGAGSIQTTPSEIKTLYGRSTVFRQCEEYITSRMPKATLVSVYDLESTLAELKNSATSDTAVIDTEEIINRTGLQVIERELVPYNRTRFAIIGRQPNQMTGYDATAFITRPLPDRVGLLVDTLNEFTRRGINILDLRSENDIKTQKLQIYLEIEGHRDDNQVSDALKTIEKQIVQEPNCIRILGSFPRVDMRSKKIKSFGFIGTGAMSCWFTERLEGEGYRTITTGRSTKLSPEDMIEEVDVVVICVPISATTSAVERYAPLLKDGQALILLAGESEIPLLRAEELSSASVELMLVHNLWGPQTITMKDKNAVIVRTRRSGSLCNEFESFLYKHGAEIFSDSPQKHDLLMGISQKLPTTISVALAMTLNEHQVNYHDLGSHSTLTSLYGVLAMARVHNQNPRTYSEIMATGGEGRKIVSSFIKNLEAVFQLAEERNIEALNDILCTNRKWMPESFLTSRMNQAQAVDAVLSDTGFKYGY